MYVLYIVGLKILAQHKVKDNFDIWTVYIGGIGG